MVKASITTEAVLLVPFIIICTIIGVYLAIYVYDRTLMVQDAENLCCLALLGEEITKEEIMSHPYMAIRDIKVTSIKKGSEISITISGEWVLPVATSFNRCISYTRTRRCADPIMIMFLTEDLRQTGGVIREWMSSELSGN